MAKIEAPKGRTLTEHLSYSQISQLSHRYHYSCARKWAYERIAGIPTTSSMPLICGSSFDTGANTFFEHEGAWQDRIQAAKEEASKVFDAMMLTENLRVMPEAGKVQAYRETMLIALHQFCHQNIETKVGQAQTRHEFTVRSADGNIRTIIGFSDRIDTDGTIVDHKYTGSNKWNAAGDWDMEWVGDKRDQLVVYWLSRMAEYQRALRSGEAWTQPPVEPAGKLVVVKMAVNSKTPTIREYAMEFTNEDRDRVLTVISEADQRARSGVYPMRPGDACQFCDALGRCRTDNERSERPFAEISA